jgi:alpha-glucosidase
MITKDQKYRFVKVEDFFNDYKKWHYVKEVSLQDITGKDITLNVTSDIGNHKILIQFVREDMFRLRFDPGAKSYDSVNTRTIVLDDFDDLRNKISNYTLESNKKTGSVELSTSVKDPAGKNLYVMKMVINYSPFSIDIFSYGDAREEFQVFSTSSSGLFFIENGFDNEYSVIQSIDKNPTAKFIGFGEQGGVELFKNTAQITYFNYDNMRYSQVYNKGPLEEKEPLYHSDPFFMEFYGVPGKKSVYGIFIDNPSEVVVDIGYLNSTRYMFGTKYCGIDYYFMLGKTCPDIIDAFTSIVGKSRLKPRYALGYHQGCYGYDTRDKVINCAQSYRASDVDIPLDGIHIDVDIQRNHKTFTIDTQGNFSDPKGMFSYLRSIGVKCSTNITPIISKENPDDTGDPQYNPEYKPYKEGIKNDYFITDQRSDTDDQDAKKYYYYEGGNNQSAVADGNYNTGNPYLGGINYGYSPLFYGHYPDFGRQEVRIWWGQQYQYLFDMGLEMIWQDMTTPAIATTQYRDGNLQSNVGFGDMKSFPARLNITDDFMRIYEKDDADRAQYTKTPFIKIWNLYSYNLHKATYHGLNNLKGRENLRNFIVGRGSFAGAHRFAALWTGDNASTWDFLKINISQCLALGLTGQAMAGQDIGGFEKGNDNGQWADPELVIRWTIMGAFLPWFRNHYTAKPGAKLFQEPYMYRYYRNTAPDNYKYMYDAVLPVCKYYIELRYRLMQLFYDKLFENTFTGMPICRAMFLNNEDAALFNDKISFINSQFLVGDDLLVAPVIEKSQTSRNVYLPADSNWYCYMDNKMPLSQAIEGGTTLDYDAHIDGYDYSHIPFTVPLFVREGGIIPSIERERYVGEFNNLGKPNPITINIYPCSHEVKRKYSMYLDDGISRASAKIDPVYGDDAAKNLYRQTDISHQYTGNTTRQISIVRVKHDGEEYTPEYEKYFFVAVLHDDKNTLKNVKINNDIVDFISGGNVNDRANTLNNYGKNAWYYNENIHISFIKVFDDIPSITVTVEYNS